MILLVITSKLLREEMKLTKSCLLLKLKSMQTKHAIKNSKCKLRISNVLKRKVTNVLVIMVLSILEKLALMIS